MACHLIVNSFCARVCVCTLRVVLCYSRTRTRTLGLMGGCRIAENNGSYVCVRALFAASGVSDVKYAHAYRVCVCVAGLMFIAVQNVKK